MVELVLVIVLLGILAVVAVPRLNTADFDEYAYAEETLAALRYARQTAVARNTTVKVSFAGNHWRICTGSPCAPLKNPANGKPWDGSAPGQGQAPAGVTIASGAAEISFNGLGSASAATTIVIGGTRHVRINSETGHVQAL